MKLSGVIKEVADLTIRIRSAGFEQMKEAMESRGQYQTGSVPIFV